ncbi:MAG: YceI family protein [Rhizomicrobium sp.]|jgi:polyisoprenoid-binding protein YceI
MRRLLAALLFAPLLVTPAWAAGWNVDYAKSRLGFTVQWSNEPFSAAFKSWKADIDFDPADLAHARATVSIDMASESSDEQEYDDGLKGVFGFEVSQFPTAHFLATNFTHKSGNDYVATGSLTIRGVTRPVTLPFTLTIAGKTAHMTGTAQLIRTDFHIGEGEWSGDTPVSHAVTVTVDLTATRF